MTLDDFESFMAGPSHVCRTWNGNMTRALHWAVRDTTISIVIKGLIAAKDILPYSVQRVFLASAFMVSSASLRLI